MARTWTAAGTFSLSSGHDINKPYLHCTNSDRDELYYVTDNASNEHDIWMYDGSTITDIAGTTFNGSDFDIVGIAYFKSNLYVAAQYNASNEMRVYKYDGTTTWSVAATLVDSSASNAIIPAATAIYPALGADNDRIVCRVDRNDLANQELLGSTTGTSGWANQTLGGSTEWRAEGVFGLHNESLYGELLVPWRQGGSVDYVGVHSSGNAWGTISANNHDTHGRFIGYDNENSKSLFDDGSGSALWSSDWGGSVAYMAFPAGNVPRTVYDFGTDATLFHGQYTFMSDGGTAIAKFDGGTAVTADGAIDDTNYKVFGFHKLGSDIVAIAYDENENVAFWTSPAPASGDEIRILGMDADSQTLYITVNDSGTLKTKFYNIEGGTAEESDTSHGAATYAQLDSYTYGLKPRALPAQDGVVFLYGRDGSDVHVQRNDRSGTAGFVDVGDGGWAAAKLASTFTPDILAPNNVTVGFYDGEVYRTFEGTTNWANTGSASMAVISGHRFRTSNHEHLFGGTTEGSIEYSPNWGDSFADAGGTALGTAHWFEESM